MIGYNGTIAKPIGHEVVTRDRRRLSQVNMCIQATNRKQVADAIGGRCTAYWVGQYCSKVLNDEMIEALSAHPPGTLLIKACDVGGTIDGETGWVKA